MLHDIIETTQNIESKQAIQGVKKNLLERIHFSWVLTTDDMVAYATCIFYVLTKREKEINEEKIVKEFLKEIHSHHPRRTLQEANVIIDMAFNDKK